MTYVLQASAQAQTFAYVLGGLFGLGVIAYFIATRAVGREGEERAHEKTIGKQLKAMTQTPVATAGGDIDSFMTDMAQLTEQTTLVGRERFWHYLTRGKRRLRVRHALRRAVSRVYGHGRPVTDADGQTIHVASVCGRLLAHRDHDELLEDIETVARAEQQGETPPATFSEYYAQDIRDGRVDIDATRSRVRGDCKTRLQENLAREGDLDRAELVETMVYESGFRYPRHVVEQKLGELLGRDVREHKDGRLEWQRF